LNISIRGGATVTGGNSSVDGGQTTNQDLDELKEDELEYQYQVENAIKSMDETKYTKQVSFSNVNFDRKI
jgi:hypothetical protein